MIIYFYLVTAIKYIMMVIPFVEPSTKGPGNEGMDGL